MHPQESNEFEGVVRTRIYAAGSKSEQACPHLCTGDATLRLRRRGEDAYNDGVLEALDGKTIRARGRVRADTLLLQDWEVITDESAPPDIDCD